jgi:hypothetical protein
MWCCLYGANIQEGFCGFGETPDKAMRDFDKNFYYQKLEQSQGRKPDPVPEPSDGELVKKG